MDALASPHVPPAPHLPLIRFVIIVATPAALPIHCISPGSITSEEIPATNLKSPTSTVSTPPPFPPFPVGIEQGSGMQDMLLNDPCSFRLAEGLTGCVWEVRHENKTLHWIPLCERPRSPLWCAKGLVTQELADLSRSSAATLTSVGIMSYTKVRAERRLRFPTPLSYTNKSFRSSFRAQPGTGLGGEGRSGCLMRRGARAGQWVRGWNCGCRRRAGVRRRQFLAVGSRAAQRGGGGAAVVTRIQPGAMSSYCTERKQGRGRKRRGCGDEAG